MRSKAIGFKSTFETKDKVKLLFFYTLAFNNLFIY